MPMRNEESDDETPDYVRNQQMGLSSQQIFSIWFNQLYQGIQITIAYSIGVYIVRHFCADESEEQIGAKTGILASAFSTAQFTTSYFWGLLTDRIGRKPVVLIANAVMGIATLLLGLAPSYGFAVAARFLGGLANGSGVAIKTMLAESCDATTQAKGMSYLNLGWGLGNVLGPVIGGFLAQPCNRWPRFPLCEDGQGLFARLPFLPPCLVVGAWSFLACFNSACMLVETHPKFRKGANRTAAPAKITATAFAAAADKYQALPQQANGDAAAQPQPCPSPTDVRNGDAAEEEEASPLLARLGSSLSAAPSETRALLRSLSGRVTGLLAAHRRLSVGSDDVDRHEFVLEMKPNNEGSQRGEKEGGSGWHGRQALLPDAGPARRHSCDDAAAASGEQQRRENGGPAAGGAAVDAPLHQRHDGAAAHHPVALTRGVRRPSSARASFGDAARAGFGEARSAEPGALETAVSLAGSQDDFFVTVFRPARSGSSAPPTPRHSLSSRTQSGLLPRTPTALHPANSGFTHGAGEASPLLQRAHTANSLPAEEPGQSGVQDLGGEAGAQAAVVRSGVAGKGSPESLQEGAEEEDGDAEQAALLAGDGEGQGGASVPWYKLRKLQLVLAGYASIAFLMNFLEELCPIYASAPYEDGGLHLATNQIALPTATAGLGLVVFALLLYPRIQRALGCLTCAKIGLTLAIPEAMLIVTPSLLVPRYAAVMGMLIPVFGAKAIVSIMCMTSSMILVNLTAPMDQIGRVNGAGNTMAAGMRALGPFLAGNLWGLAASSGLPYKQFAAFGTVALAFLCTRILYGRLRL